MNSVSGNILGGPRAESDLGMLSKAFVETADFTALSTTKDFNFVVGRRGTGKSALYIRLNEYIKSNKIGHVFCVKPMEYNSLRLLSIINPISKDYRTIKSITRVAWRVSVLLSLLNKISKHYKFNKVPDYNFLNGYLTEYEKFIDNDCFVICSQIIKALAHKAESVEQLPGIIASTFKVEHLNNAISETLLTINKAIYYFFDGLDEGWKPEESPTAILGGLAACASDFSDTKTNIQILLFIRDNVFRSLNFFDPDFSRHIEGNTLRLKWDENSLLHLISDRLRVTLGLENLESDVKVWNRFARKGLENKAGFNSCLNYTLFRPRDLIVLLNSAFMLAARSGRTEIIKDDVESSSKQISKDRLSDLLKEYDKVFPGLPLFTNTFLGKQAFRKYGEVVNDLEEEIQNQNFEEQESSDFALMGSGKEAFFALYSVGFIGIENPATKNLQFCHDGSSADIDATNINQRTCVHPCYWKTLETQSEVLEESVLIEVYDEDIPKGSSDEIIDIRTKQVGQLISSLPAMPEGKEDAGKFEEWVHRTAQILFSGKLVNPELKPNKDAVQRRDIVATNIAEKGFWRRVLDDYSSRQVIFEVKNYSSLKVNDFRQALSYSGPPYGQFIIIVNRSSSEGLSLTERGWVKEIWDRHNVLCFVLPAPMLSRCISKLRKKQRFDYTENVLSKRLDTFLRSYLSLRHITKSKSKK